MIFINFKAGSATLVAPPPRFFPAYTPEVENSCRWGSISPLRSLTHPNTFSHSFPHSFPHPLTLTLSVTQPPHSLTHTINHSLSHSLTHLLTFPLARSLTFSHTHALTLSCTHTLMQSPSHALTFSCDHSINHVHTYAHMHIAHIGTHNFSLIKIGYQTYAIAELNESSKICASSDQCCGAGAGRSQPFLVGAGSRSRPSQGAGAGADQNLQNLGSSLKIT